MILSRRLRRGTQTLIGPVLGVALTGYFAYNLVIGDRGLSAWWRLSQQLQTQEASLVALQEQRKALDRKVSNLSPEHLDLDLLDERVRATLNLVAPNEVVIMREGPPH